MHCSISSLQQPAQRVKTTHDGMKMCSTSSGYSCRISTKSSRGWHKLLLYTSIRGITLCGPLSVSLGMWALLTADSVKNNSVKLSIKFMVFEIQSKGPDDLCLEKNKISRPNVAFCSQAWSLQVRQYTRGPAKTSLKRQEVVKANPCWSQGYNPSRVNFFFFFFFLSQLLPIIFKISRNTRIQDAQRLTLFRSRPLFSCKGVAIHITEIIPCLLSQPSPSVCPFETWSRGRGWRSVEKKTVSV